MIGKNWLFKIAQIVRNLSLNLLLRTLLIIILDTHSNIMLFILYCDYISTKFFVYIRGLLFINIKISPRRIPKYLKYRRELKWTNRKLLTPDALVGIENHFIRPFSIILDLKTKFLSSKSDPLTGIIIKSIIDKSKPLNKCRRQWYDGAYTIKGTYGGVHEYHNVVLEFPFPHENRRIEIDLFWTLENFYYFLPKKLNLHLTYIIFPKYILIHHIASYYI